MRKVKIPDFFTADMWKKYVSIWFLPSLFFLLAMYVTAFTKDSFVFIIFSMAIMMHPVISIPISFSLKCAKFLTMSFYFAMITVDSIKEMNEKTPNIVTFEVEECHLQEFIAFLEKNNPKCSNNPIIKQTEYQFRFSRFLKVSTRCQRGLLGIIAKR